MAPALFAANLLVILNMWSASGFLEENLSGPLIATGRLMGLLAFYFIMWQLLLISRVGWIEKYWGHDRLSRLHHYLGITGISVLFFHPIFLTLGYSREAQITLAEQFGIFLTYYHDVLGAFVGYLMFLIIVGVSLELIRKRLKYEWWYLVHLLLYGAILITFDHQIANGHDFAGEWEPIYWKILFYGTLLNVGYYRFLKPILSLRKYDFRVESIRQENNNVNSIIISGRDLSRFKARAGQFVLVRFIAKGFWTEAHPFSLSEMPDGKRLRLTVKMLGDFTGRLPFLPIGTRVIIEGPLGRFTVDRARKDKILLIAGGIGITPLRSLFEEFSKSGRQVELVYAANSEADFVLKNELDKLAGNNAKVHYISADREGRLTDELLKKEIPDITERSIYLCGPPVMMKVVRGSLARLGVPRNNILYEKFSLG